MLHFISADDTSTNERIDVHDMIEGEALKYIAGYAVHRFRTKYPYLGVPTRQLDTLHNPPNWITFFSERNLMYPSDVVIYATNKMNKIFQEFHGSFLSKEKWIFRSVTKLVQEKIKKFDVPKEVIECLVRTRTYIRLREINKKLKSDIRNKHRTKKITKFF